MESDKPILNNIYAIKEKIIIAFFALENKLLFLAVLKKYMIGN